MGKKQVIQFVFFSIIGLILVSLSCTSPIETNSIGGDPTHTLINIQLVVQETLNAYTAIAVQATNARIIPPTPSETPTQCPPTKTLVPPPSKTATSESKNTCNFSYLPIRTDISWFYQFQAAGDPLEKYTLRFGAVTSETFTEYKEFENRNSEIIWYCTPQGLIQSQFTQMNIPGIPEGFNLETVDYSGVTFPLPELFEVGATWTTSYLLQGNMITEVGEMKANIDITMENSLAAKEEITVPFGSYPHAARVDSQVTMLISTQVGGFAGPPTEITFNMSAWYVEGVGMVKSVSEEQRGNTVTELISMK